MKAIIFFILFILVCASIFSQNITNTLGTSGLFKIKDGSTDYMTLSQSTGQLNILKTLRLENTSNSTTGIIFKGTDRFLHNYGTYNTFLGVTSGNFTMSGYSNTAVGSSSLRVNTTGYFNSAFGFQALYSNTDGNLNSAFGVNSLYSNSTGLP
ncbi:MAG: hypothetical protein L0Y79_02550 [Chlorobi bacterium]|nr:hypothetical protein [Chlorobiota bacterium]MCI0715720.1 hypothetical protein [Chlorobiota bacterium]